MIPSVGRVRFQAQEHALFMREVEREGEPVGAEDAFNRNREEAADVEEHLC